MNSGARRGLGLILTIAVVLGLKFYNKGSNDDAIKKQMAQVIHQLPDYKNNAKFIDSIFDSAHELAFEQSYKMGGRRQSSEIDQNRYLAILFADMSRKAKEAKQESVYTTLELQR